MNDMPMSDFHAGFATATCTFIVLGLLIIMFYFAIDKDDK